MNYAALVRAHRLKRNAPLLFNGFCSLGNGYVLELFFALGAVVFAIYHDAPVFIPADVGNCAGYALNGIENFASAADYCRGVGGLYFDFNLFAVGNDFVESGNFKNF